MYIYFIFYVSANLRICLANLFSFVHYSLLKNFYPLKTILEYFVLCRTKCAIRIDLLAMFKTFPSVFVAIVGCCMMQI